MNKYKYMDKAKSLLERFNRSSLINTSDKYIIKEDFSGFEEDDESIDIDELVKNQRVVVVSNNIRLVENYDTVGKLILTDKKIIYVPELYDIAKSEDPIEFKLSELTYVNFIDKIPKIKYNVLNNKKEVYYKKSNKRFRHRYNPIVTLLIHVGAKQFHFVGTDIELSTFANALNYSR